MKKIFEKPTVEFLSLEAQEDLTSDPEERLSGLFDYGEDVEEW